MKLLIFLYSKYNLLKKLDLKRSVLILGKNPLGCLRRVEEGVTDEKEDGWTC